MEREEIIEKAKQVIRKNQPHLSEIEVEIEISKQLEYSASINRAMLELEAESLLEGLSLADQLNLINRQAFGDQTEKLRMELKVRELDSLKLNEKRRKRMAAKLEAFLDLPNQSEFTTEFLEKWIKNAGYEVSKRAIQQGLQRAEAERDKAQLDKADKKNAISYKGIEFKAGRDEVIEFLTKFHKSPRRRRPLKGI